jgi:hypothetical protein
MATASLLCGRLARPVRAEEPEHLAPLDPVGHVVDRHGRRIAPVEALGEVLERDGLGSGGLAVRANAFASRP